MDYADMNCHKDIMAMMGAAEKEFYEKLTDEQKELYDRNELDVMVRKCNSSYPALLLSKGSVSLNGGRKEYALRVHLMKLEEDGEIDNPDSMLVQYDAVRCGGFLPPHRIRSMVADMLTNLHKYGKVQVDD